MSGTYCEYKKCTKQFIDWIIHTSKLVNSSCLRLPPTLSSLLTRVSVITSSSTTVKTENSHVQGIISELGTILKVGARAIKLREMVHSFHLSQSARLTSTTKQTEYSQPSNNSGSSSTTSSVVDDYHRSNDDHKFCIDRLKECYRLLTLWYRNNQPDTCNTSSHGNSGNNSIHPSRFTTSFASISIHDNASGASATGSVDNLDHCDNIFRVLADETESTLGGASCYSGGYQDMDLTDSITEYSTVRSAGASSPTPSTHSVATTCATETTLNSSRGSETRTIDQIDQDFGDLRLTLICFMLDMMQLAEKVNDAWKKVRAMDSDGNYYVACLETISAIKLVTTLQAQVQLKYPSIVEVRDLFSAGLHRSLTDNEITSLYNKNEFMKEFRFVAITLSSFSTSFKANAPVEERSTLVHRRGFFGTPFVESHFPLGTSLEDCMRFLPRELAELYNNHWDFQQVRKLMVNPTAHTTAVDISGITSAKDLPSDRLTDFPLTKIFLAPLIHQFETGHVSITENFAVYCWWKSILILEDRDHLMLAKHAYLNRKYMRSMDEKWKPYQECIDTNLAIITSGNNKNARPAVPSVDVDCETIPGFMVNRSRLMYQLFASIKPENLALLRRVRTTIPCGILGNINAYYHNPILSTSALIEKLLLNFRANVQLLQDVPHLPRALCHLYRMLLQEGYLTKKNDVMEDFIKSYRSILFFGKEKDSVTTSGKVRKGEYLTNYLLSENFTTQAIATLKATKKLPTSASDQQSILSRNIKKTAAKVQIGNVSDLYQVVYENDLSRLLNRNNTPSVSVNTVNDNNIGTCNSTLDNETFSGSNSISHGGSSNEFDRILNSVKQCVNQEMFDQGMLILDILPVLSMLKDIAVGLIQESLTLGLISAQQLANNAASIATSINEENLLSLKTVYDSTMTVTIHALSVIDDFLPDVVGLKDSLDKFAAVFSRELTKTEGAEHFYLLPRECGESLYIQEFGPMLLKMKRNVWIPAAMDKSRRAHERKIKAAAATVNIKGTTGITVKGTKKPDQEVNSQRQKLQLSNHHAKKSSEKDRPQSRRTSSMDVFYEDEEVEDDDEEVARVLRRDSADYEEDDMAANIEEDEDDADEFGEEEVDDEEEDEENEEIMHTFFQFMDTLQVLEVNLSCPTAKQSGNSSKSSKTTAILSIEKSTDATGTGPTSVIVDIQAFKEELRTTINQMPEIVKRFEPGVNTHNRSRYQTLLDFFVCGILQDEDMAEFILAQGGLLLRTPNCSPFGYSHLQLACLDGVDWAVSLMVKAGQGVDFDYRDKLGNTALHYAAMHNQMNIANTLIYAGANVECRNNAGKRPCDMIKPISKGAKVNNSLLDAGNVSAGDSVFEKYLRVLTGDLIQQEQVKVEEAPAMSLQRQQALNAKHSAHSKKVHKALRQEEEEVMKSGSSKKVVTAEDLERAERAKQELFAMLDSEEKEKGKTSKKANKKKANAIGSSGNTTVSGESTCAGPCMESVTAMSSSSCAIKESIAPPPAVGSWASVVAQGNSALPTTTNSGAVGDANDISAQDNVKIETDGGGSSKKKKTTSKKKK